MNRPLVSSSNLSPSMSLAKKKTFDYSDHHYRDAISRLKVMLSDTYSAPIKYSSSSSVFKSVTDDDTDTTDNTILERPMNNQPINSKYVPYKTYSTCSSSYKPPNYLQIPCELFYSSNTFTTINNFTVALSFDTSHAGGSNDGEPKELLSFIEKQENYIDQLEKESNYCRVRFLNSINFTLHNIITHIINKQFRMNSQR